LKALHGSRKRDRSFANVDKLRAHLGLGR
jgi:hypothetical protein